MSAQIITIGRLASEAGTNVETVRFYEKAGLLPAPLRTGSNYRSYDPSHICRLTFIRRARALGFSLDQIRELISLADQRTRSCSTADAIAKAHRAEIERKIADLQILKTELDSIIGRCGSGVVEDCRVIRALTPKSSASAYQQA